MKKSKRHRQGATFTSMNKIYDYILYIYYYTTSLRRIIHGCSSTSLVQLSSQSQSKSKSTRVVSSQHSMVLTLVLLFPPFPIAIFSPQKNYQPTLGSLVLHFLLCPAQQTPPPPPSRPCSRFPFIPLYPCPKLCKTSKL